MATVIATATITMTVRTMVMTARTTMMTGAMVTAVVVAFLPAASMVMLVAVLGHWLLGTCIP